MTAEPTAVQMPRLTDSMEEATIVRWLKSVGDDVAVGDELVEVETDKANMACEAFAAGTLLAITAQEGDTCAIGSTLAWIGEPGAQIPAPGQQNDRLKASPIARRLAGAAGLDLATVTPSGPGGRITRADVEQALAVSDEGEAAAPGATDAGRGEAAPVELTRLQLAVARTMATAWTTVPHIHLSTTVDMGRCRELRATMVQSAGEREPRPSFNDFVVKASALALRDWPRANGAYRDGSFRLYSRVNVGVAVAAPDTLIVPTVFDADRRGLLDIAGETRRLAERVRQGTITPPELADGTFTVSNLGMHGVEEFDPIVTPPQAAILGVGEIAERPVVRAGQLVPALTMKMTLACDHRILYGADGAGLLNRIRALLQEPGLMAA